ncbi:unnamed protein product [Closterium sp. Naga37s-1]|nr:unnamed protein product [Closterium sp. Naga37s-1]
MADDPDPGDPGGRVGGGLDSDVTGAFGGEGGVSTVAAGGSLHLLTGHKRRGGAESALQSPRIRRLHHEDLLCLFGKPAKRQCCEAGRSISVLTCGQPLEDPPNTGSDGDYPVPSAIIGERGGATTEKGPVDEAAVVPRVASEVARAAWEEHRRRLQQQHDTRRRCLPVRAMLHGAGSADDAIPPVVPRLAWRQERRRRSAAGKDRQQEPLVGGQRDPQVGGQQGARERSRQPPSGGQQELPSGGQRQLPSGGQRQLQSGGQQELQSEGQQELQSGGQQQLQSGGQQQLQSGGQQQLPSGGQRELQSGGQQQLQSGGQQEPVWVLDVEMADEACTDELESSPMEGENANPDSPDQAERPRARGRGRRRRATKLQQLQSGGQQQLPSGEQQQLQSGGQQQLPSGGQLQLQSGGQQQLPSGGQQQLQSGGHQLPSGGQQQLQSGGQQQLQSGGQQQLQSGGQQQLQSGGQQQLQSGGQQQLPSGGQRELQSGGQQQLQSGGQQQLQSGGQQKLQSGGQQQLQSGGQQQLQSGGQQELQSGGQRQLQSEGQQQLQSGGQQQLQCGGMELARPLEGGMETESSRRVLPACSSGEEHPDPTLTPPPRIPCETCYRTFTERGKATRHMSAYRAADAQRRAQALGLTRDVTDDSDGEPPPPRDISEEVWAAVPTWDWESFFGIELVPGRIMRRIPQRARLGVLDALSCVLKRLQLKAADEAASLVFLAFPRLILGMPTGQGQGHRAAIRERLEKFWVGEWRELFELAVAVMQPAARPLSFTPPRA